MFVWRSWIKTTVTQGVLITTTTHKVYKMLLLFGFIPLFISFDWDAFAGDEENNIFSFQTGYGFLFDDFELSDCYDEDYEALNLTRESITAEFLASVEKINEFHINFINENDKEIDLGYNDDEQYKIKIMLIEFVDVNTGNVYKVNQNVIDKYNMNN